MKKRKTFKIYDFVTNLYSEHEIGNANCDEGWCGGTGYPKKCKCGGLIHAEFGDEDLDCNYFLIEECDRCGKKFKPE